MRKHRITDDEAAAVLRGQAPAARPDLESMVDAVTMFRRASFESSPQPSAELSTRLDLERAMRISASADELYASTAASTPVIQVSVPRTRRRSVALSGFVGLGLAAKIAIGAAAAAAVGVTGAGAAGAVGVLPSAAQEVFDQVTGQHPGGENVSETGIENSEFGLKTAEEARLNGEQKREAALENAEEKRQAGLENANEKAQTALETAEEKAQAGLETAENARDVTDEHGSTGLETAEDAATNAENRPAPGGND